MNTSVTNCVKYSDKATSAEAIAGTNDNKYITPKGTADWYSSIRASNFDLLYQRPFSSIPAYAGATNAVLNLSKSMLSYSRVYFIADRLRYIYSSNATTYPFSFTGMPGSNVDFPGNSLVENESITIGGGAISSYVTILIMLAKDSSYVHYAVIEHVGGYSPGSSYAAVRYIKLSTSYDYSKFSIRFSSSSNMVYYGDVMIYGEK